MKAYVVLYEYLDGVKHTWMKDQYHDVHFSEDLAKAQVEALNEEVKGHFKYYYYKTVTKG